MPGTTPPDDLRTQTLRDQLLALRAFARAQMGAALLARESPSDVVQGVCEDLLRLRTGEPATAEPIADIGRLRHLIRFKVQERQRYWRRQKRNGDAADVEPDRQPAAARGPETMAILREWLIEMRRLVEALPARQRLAVQRFYLDGRSMGQVGDELECSEDAAKMLVARGMAALRERRRRRGG
ncbi:MAG: sigma-70 family RNA polymerase sigma factor [Planctomycetes bacterium]|nr:sigma-70 family RNA polymerase sigma factor [Planctomycetota bacterium]